MELLIQKICSCCSNEILDLFYQYLTKNNQNLSADLIDCIREKPSDSAKNYSIIIYHDESKESFKKLNQLAHHTIKLFSFVSQNFPSFLWKNIQDIEWLIFKNDNSLLHKKIKYLKEVAEKFEDYNLLIHLDKIIKQQNLPLNVSVKNEYLNYFNSIEQLIEIQNRIIKENSNAKNQIDSNELEEISKHFNSKSKSVEIIAKQSYLNVLSSCNHTSFYEVSTLKLIKDTIKETEKYGYLMIAQHTEKLMSLDYMYVKHTRLTLDEKEMNKACSSIIKKWQNHFSTNGKLDVGLTMAISIKGSYYITNYFYNTIPKKITQEIKEVSSMVEQLLKEIDWKHEGYLKYINLCNVQSLYFILEDKCDNAIKLIEKTLHEFQQKQFNKLYDGIFVILIMAYFKNNQFEGVVETYNRFKKITKGEVSVKENELVIKALYYIAQLKLKESKQYENKLNKVIKELKENELMKNNLQLVERVQKAIL